MTGARELPRRVCDDVAATLPDGAPSLLEFGPERIVEVGSAQAQKGGQRVAGDTIRTRRIAAEERHVVVLSDGLGSGVKASVLSSLTATMAIEYATSDLEPARVAGIIMRTLPECSVRKIRYATFTAVNIRSSGLCDVVNYDNPGPFLLDAAGCRPIELTETELPGATTRRTTSYVGRTALSVGEYLIIVSDGVTQAGIGTAAHPVGWREAGLCTFVEQQYRDTPGISAGELAERIVAQAVLLDGGSPRDDISCAVVYLRTPRRLLIATGPPIDPQRDHDLAETVASYPGRVVIAGGTTAKIVSRELDRAVTVRLAERDPEIPPTSEMEGVDLVTEGTITMSRAADLLERSAPAGSRRRPNGADRLAAILRESDEIHIVVGTRINEAHQNPSVPVDLEIRRNLMKRIRRVLEEQHLKRTHLYFM